jgi:predicted CopG family antitoxin
MGHKLIAVSEENYEILKRLGNIGDTFNDVVTVVLKKIDTTNRKPGIVKEEETKTL